jgi:hypothetical protein
MGKLEISKELSDKISNSLRIKKTDIVDGSANKPIIIKLESPKKYSPQRQPTPKYSPIKKDSPQRQQSPKNSPIKNRYKSLRPLAQRDSSPKNTPMSNRKIIHRLNTSNKLDYMKISKIVFISSIVGGIGITLGIKLGTILFL